MYVTPAHRPLRRRLYFHVANPSTSAAYTRIYRAIVLEAKITWGARELTLQYRVIHETGAMSYV